MGTTTNYTEEAHKMIKSWQNCLPGEISNLFYYIDEHSDLQRYTTFYLEQEGINILTNPPSDIDTIRIYMACGSTPNGPRAGTPTFVPILGIVFKDHGVEEILFPLQYVQFQQFTKISSAISDLFRQKWIELSNDKVAEAFSGYTVVDTSGAPGVTVSSPPANLRVNFYTFDHKDVTAIQAKLRGFEGYDPFLKLHLGAGLTVEIMHPFNFRPILEVGIIQNGNDGDGDDDSDNYERSQPCPPYCSGGIG